MSDSIFDFVIPKNITKRHILNALLTINKEGYPVNRKSKRWDLIFDGIRYPPKVVISYANRFANGHELSHYDFSGGPETNDYLMGLGFDILEKDI
jgi:hypothetical protein